MASKPYNGHKNYNHWNVALWIGGDEGLYSFACDCKRRSANAKEAAKRFVADLNELGIDKTPDGVKYSISAVEKALVGL